MLACSLTQGRGLGTFVESTYPSGIHSIPLTEWSTFHRDQDCAWLGVPDSIVELCRGSGCVSLTCLVRLRIRRKKKCRSQRHLDRFQLAAHHRSRREVALQSTEGVQAPQPDLPHRVQRGLPQLQESALIVRVSQNLGLTWPSPLIFLASLKGEARHSRMPTPGVSCPVCSRTDL